MQKQWSLSYAEAESILAKLHGVPDDTQKGAFRGRLKHLRRLGIPIDSHTGRGSKISYLPDQLFQWAFCLELAEFGIDPVVIATFIKSKWSAEISEQFLATLTSGTDQFFVWNPCLMSNGSEPETFQFDWSDFKKLVTHSIHRVKNLRRRAMIINISDLTKEIDRAAAKLHAAR